MLWVFLILPSALVFSLKIYVHLTWVIHHLKKKKKLKGRAVDRLRWWLGVSNSPSQEMILVFNFRILKFRAPLFRVWFFSKMCLLYLVMQFLNIEFLIKLLKLRNHQSEPTPTPFHVTMKKIEFSYLKKTVFFSYPHIFSTQRSSD